MLKYLLKTHVYVLGYVCSCSVHLIVCCVHCYAVRLIIAFVDVNKTYLILSYLLLPWLLFELITISTYRQQQMVTDGTRSK